MKNLNLKKIAAAILTVAVLLTTTACAARQKPAEDTAAEPQTTQQTTVPDAEQQTFRIGICNYVDDASLNQIVENIQTRLAEISEETGVQFAVDYDNCNADATVMEQIIANFQSNGADLLVGVATPVAMRMQTATRCVCRCFRPGWRRTRAVAGSTGQQRDRNLRLSGYRSRYESDLCGQPGCGKDRPSV